MVFCGSCKFFLDFSKESVCFLSDRRFCDSAISMLCNTLISKSSDTSLLVNVLQNSTVDGWIPKRKWLIYFKYLYLGVIWFRQAWWPVGVQVWMSSLPEDFWAWQSVWTHPLPLIKALLSAPAWLLDLKCFIAFACEILLLLLASVYTPSHPLDIPLNRDNLLSDQLSGGRDKVCMQSWRTVDRDLVILLF